MVGDPASIESPVEMRTPRKSYTVAFNAAAEEKKFPGRLVPLPNVKIMRSKIGSRDKVGYKPGGSHVKMHTQKLDSSKTPAVRAEVIQGGPTISMRPETKNNCAGEDQQDRLTGPQSVLSNQS
jgi:hypothetical protein